MLKFTVIKSELKSDCEPGRWLMPVTLATWWGHPGEIVHETLISKITRAKHTEGVAQALEHLLCKHEPLMSSNASPTKKKKKKREREKVNVAVMGVVAHSCNPSSWESQGGRISSSGPTQIKLVRPYLRNKI
jgi:hypothetical protein